MTTDEGPVLDAAILEELRALQGPSSPHFLAEIIALFLRDTPPRLAEIREALEKRDVARLERAAHTLKGGSGNLGARRVALACARIEEAVRKKDWPAVADLARRIEEEFALAGEALKAERDR